MKKTKNAQLVHEVDTLFISVLQQSKALEQSKAPNSEAETALARTITGLKEAEANAEAAGVNMAMTARVKLALLNHWGSILDVPADAGPLVTPPRPFDPDAAFETIRLRKGCRPAADATTTGDAGGGRFLTQRRHRQGTPTLRTLGRRYEIIFRACETVRRKEKLFNYRDPTTPARVAALYAAREALFERLGGRGPRRRC